MSVDDPERRLLVCGVMGGVVAVFFPRQPIQPRLRLVTREAPEIHRNGWVDHLRLAFDLWMERCTQTPLILKRSLQKLPVNTGSCSLKIEAGNPCSLTMPSKKALVTDTAVLGCPKAMK